MKQLVLIIIIAFSLTSCASSHIDKWMNKRYSSSMVLKAKQKSDDIIVNSNVPSKGDVVSNTHREASKFLPLLFYWHVEEKWICVLNSKIPVNNFTSTISAYANKSLKQKLNGKHLELSVDSIPTTFAIDEKENVIWLLYAVNWNFISIQPDIKNLVVSYKLLSNDNEETKKGVITIKDLNKSIAVKIFQSPKNKMFEYLDQYDNNISLMSKRVIDKLITEL